MARCRRAHHHVDVGLIETMTRLGRPVEQRLVLVDRGDGSDQQVTLQRTSEQLSLGTSGRERADGREFEPGSGVLRVSAPAYHGRVLQ